MANPLAKTLIAVVAALVASGAAMAQDDSLFRSAVRKLRTNDTAGALADLQAFVATNPDHEAAWQLWQDTDSAVWQMLILQKDNPEFGTIAKHLMNLATAGQREVSRDASTINELVETATSSKDYATRTKAMLDLASDHCEFAVPSLVKALGNHDSDIGQSYAILALQKIGSPATLPLVQALRSSDDLTRRNVAAALQRLADPRAAAALAHVAATDSDESVREIARRSLAKLGVAAGATAVDLYVKDAHQYLTGTGLSGYSASEVVWTFADDELVSHDVPSELYHLELAKGSAHSAMRLDPANDSAKALLARSYLAEVAVIEESIAANPDNEGMAAAASQIESLRMVALASGKDTLRKALADSMADNMAHVAIAAADALGSVESRKDLGSSPLYAAMNSGNSQVAYAASLAITKIANGSADIPHAAQVVATLGNAVTLEGERLVKVIGGGESAKAAVQNASSNGKGGVAADASADGRSGIRDIYNFPNYDIVIIDEALSDTHPRNIINLVRERAPNAKILLRTADEDGASEAYGDQVDGFLAGELTGESLIAKANEVVEVLDGRRAKANATAVAASHALKALAAANVDVSGATTQLGAQLDRSDDIAIPAAGALGAGGSLADLGALAGAVMGDGSLELKIACANAAGDILGRADSVPADVFEGMAALAADADADMALRTAVVTAIGKGKLAPGERLKLAELLGTIAKAGDSL